MHWTKKKHIYYLDIKREKYNNSQIRIIIVMAAIFSAVRQIVDYIFTVYSFNGATIKKYPFVLYSLMEFVVIWIFFVATGLLQNT